ncbi:MAG: oligosaccharide flippase family protein [Planctomycetes bacterium]|nr:oligosaccharide flippase family protein [Planctomycetota bacterium]
MLKNIGSNWALSAIQIVMFMVLVPFVANTLSLELYGSWEVIVNFTGPMQLLALGIPMATVRHITAAIAEGKPEEAERVIGTSMTLSLLLGLVALALGSIVYQFASQAILTSDRWSLTPADLKDTQQALLAMLLLVGSSFALRLPYAIFDAHHDFVVRNLIQGAGFLLRFALTLVALSWKPSTTVLAGVLITVAICEFLVATRVSSKRHRPLRVRPGRPDGPLVKKLFAFGIFAFLINMGSVLAFQIDATVIGLFLEPEHVVEYALGNKIFEQFITLVLAIGMVAMPMATDLWSRKDPKGVTTVFLKWSKISTSLVLLVGGYLIVFGPEFLEVWLGESYTPQVGVVMQILMASFFFFLPMRGVALPVLMGIGKTRGPGYGLLAMGLSNLAISLFLVQHYGILGVAFGTVIPNVIFSVFFLWWTCKHLELSMDAYLKYVVQKSIFGALPAVAFLLIVRRWVETPNWWIVLSAGVAYSAIFMLSQVFFVYRNDAYTDPLALIRSKLGARQA